MLCTKRPQVSGLSEATSCACEVQVESKRQRPDLHRRSTGGPMLAPSQPDSLKSNLSTSSGSTCGSSIYSDDSSLPASRESSVTSTVSPSSLSGSFTQQGGEMTDFDHWQAREAFYTPQAIFALQSNITPSMREMLVEWMCEVVIQYRMHLETFLLAVNYVDRYLCKVPIHRTRFQLLGLTCLWIAAKYEEVHPPSTKQLLEMADNAFTRAEMYKLEGEVLSTLGWQVCPATSLKFMHLYLVKCQATSYTVQAVAECMLQLAALDAKLCAEQAPSHVAAAAACVALTTCHLSHLVPVVVQASGWGDPHALAQMSHDLYAHFGRLSAPGMPFHPIIAHYAQRQRAINRHMQPDHALAHGMVPPASAAPAYKPPPPPAPVIKPAPAPMPAPAPAPAPMQYVLAPAPVQAKDARMYAHPAKLQVAPQSCMMDCAPMSDQTRIKAHSNVAAGTHLLAGAFTALSLPSEQDVPPPAAAAYGRLPVRPRVGMVVGGVLPR